MSDTALQQLSRDRDPGPVGRALREQSQNPPYVQSETAEGFEHRHGTGYRLRPDRPSFGPS